MEGRQVRGRTTPTKQPTPLLFTPAARPARIYDAERRADHFGAGVAKWGKTGADSWTGHKPAKGKLGHEVDHLSGAGGLVTSGVDSQTDRALGQKHVDQPASLDHFKSDFSVQDGFDSFTDVRRGKAKSALAPRDHLKLGFDITRRSDPPPPPGGQRYSKSNAARASSFGPGMMVPEDPDNPHMTVGQLRREQLHNVRHDMNLGAGKKGFYHQVPGVNEWQSAAQSAY